MMLSEKAMGANRRMIFTPSTVYRDSYKARPMVSNADNLSHRPVHKTKASKPFVQKYYETHMPIARPLPFDVFLKPKEIIRTVPSQAQERYEKLIDEDLEEVQRTRPRVIMTPQVSVDDIPEPQARQRILEQTYTSTATKAAKEIFLKKYEPCAVEMEWRMDSVKWDAKQLRSYVDPDKVFWKDVDLYKSCGPCQETAVVRKQRRRNMQK